MVPLSRSSTMEAQRDRPSKARKLRDWANATIHGPDDFAELELKSAISMSRGSERASLKKLLRNYKLFKSSLGAAVRNNLFQCWTFQEGARDNIMHSQVKDLPEDSVATFSAVITAISKQWPTTRPNGLRVLVISFEAIADNEKNFSSVRRKIIATLRGQLHSLPAAPNNVIAFLIAQRLKIPRPSLKSAEDPSINDNRRRLLQPPSQKIPPGNLDPAKLEDDHIELTWQMKAPTFTVDFDIWIWEKYKALPESRCADIRLYPQSGTDETKLIILFQHSASLGSFISFRNDTSIYRPTPATNVQIWTPNSEAFFSICATFQVMILEMTEFLQGCSLELEKMNLLVRQKPTTNKLRYLVHLEDCRQSAHKGVVHGLRVLDCLSKWIDTQQISQPLWCAGESFQSRLATLRSDLEFFRDQFPTVGNEIKELQQTLHEHLNMTHNRRNFILTIIAAIYLPLSFAASLFGMNINSTTSASPQGFSNWTASWINGSSVDTQNSTKALVSAIGSSGPRSYSWRTFSITAACLLVSIPLSLSIEDLLRLAYRGTIYNVSYWRVFAVFPSAAFIYFSIFGAIPIYHNDLILENYGYSYVIPYSAYSYFISMACNVLLSLFLFRRMRKFTIIQGIIILAPIPPLVVVTFIFRWPVMLYTWLTLLYFDWLMPWWRRRKQKKARGQDAAADSH